MNSSLRFMAMFTLALVVAACSHSNPPDPSPTPAGAPPRTLAELFEGKFTGVKVTQVSNGVRLVIRNARNSDGSEAYPLYVVDGSPIAAPDGVFSMNPNDILKIEILKDDASTLVWGERGANGVVKITTKRK
jgi:iron complex outermembrane receptor protein